MYVLSISYLSNLTVFKIVIFGNFPSCFLIFKQVRSMLQAACKTLALCISSCAIFGVHYIILNLLMPLAQCKFQKLWFLVCPFCFLVIIKR